MASEVVYSFSNGFQMSLPSASWPVQTSRLYAGKVVFPIVLFSNAAQSAAMVAADLAASTGMKAKWV